MRPTLAAEERLALIYRILNYTGYPGATPELKQAGYEAAFEVSCTDHIQKGWLELVAKETGIDMSWYIGLVEYRTKNG